jgi:hypothetical protein
VGRSAKKRGSAPLTFTLGVMKKQVIGYTLSGHDNDSYMLGEETRRALSDEEREFFDWRFLKNSRQHPATCPKCGRKIDHEYIDPSFQLHKKSMDISSTYDGYTIVSKKFKIFCANHAINGIEFITLPSQPKHYWLVIRNILEVDKSKSLGIRFLYYCDLCESYAGVFGTSRLRFKGVESPIIQGFYRTDLEFAQAHQQSPVIVVGTEVGTAIKAAQFKGVCLNKIEYA